MASAAFEDIAETFEFLDDWEDRYRHVIELGKAMAPMDDALKVPATKVDGCASQVWMVPLIEDGKFRFVGDSDALANILAHGDMRDPDLAGLVITVPEVRMSPDLKIATAFVAPLNADDDQAVIKALARHAKFIRGRVSGALRQMKYMPDFRFRLDTSFDNFRKIDELLHSPEVARDLGHDDDNDNDNEED